MSLLLTSVDINAPRARVWEALTDFPRHREWNPYMLRLEGTLAVGERLTVTTPPLLRSPHTFRPTVIGLEHGRAFRWVGVGIAPWLFRGEHFFRLEDIAPGRTRLLHGERFSGALIPGHALLRYGSTKRGFERMNAALRRHVEADG